MLVSFSSDLGKKIGRAGLSGLNGSLAGMYSKPEVMSRTVTARRRVDRAEIRAALDDMESETHFAKVEAHIQWLADDLLDLMTRDYDYYDNDDYSLDGCDCDDCQSYRLGLGYR